MHLDLVGNYLNIGDKVVYAKGNHLHHGIIVATTPKMVRVEHNGWDRLVFPDDCILPGRMPV